MSDTVYRIIPKNPNFLPPENTIKQLLSLLTNLNVKGDVTWKKYDNPTFIDCGGNFTFVSCPSCNEVIADVIWGDMMDKCYENGHFYNLETVTPCCDFKTTLNDLKYDWDCGFAKFVIEILNPEKPLSPFVEWKADNGLGGLLELEDYRIIVARI